LAISLIDWLIWATPRACSSLATSICSTTVFTYSISREILSKVWLASSAMRPPDWARFEADGPRAALAVGLALGGGLETVVGGVAQHVQKRIVKPVRHQLVDGRVLARDVELDRLVGLALELADHALEAAEHLAHRHKPQLGRRVLQVPQDHDKPVRGSLERFKLVPGQIGRVQGFRDARGQLADEIDKPRHLVGGHTQQRGAAGCAITGGRSGSDGVQSTALGITIAVFCASVMLSALALNAYRGGFCNRRASPFFSRRQAASSCLPSKLKMQTPSKPVDRKRKVFFMVSIKPPCFFSKFFRSPTVAKKTFTEISPSLLIRTVRPDILQSGIAAPSVSVTKGAAICAASRLGNLRWYVFESICLPAGFVSPDL
jgi:hypothetical protein